MLEELLGTTEDDDLATELASKDTDHVKEPEGKFTRSICPWSINSSIDVITFNYITLQVVLAKNSQMVPEIVDHQ